MSDPVLYPLPHGSREGLRQDAARTRAELAATVTELTRRLDPVHAARRASGRIAAGTAALAGAALAATVAHRTSARSAKLAGWTLAVGLVVTARHLATRPAAQDSHRVETPVAATNVTPLPASASAGGDVVDALVGQHRHIEDMFARVAAAPAETRREMLAALVEYLNRHEHAEQHIVHPALYEHGDTDAAVVEERLDEERHADLALASLISRDIDDPEFDDRLAALAEMVRAHASHEEIYEFPLLRQRLDPTLLQRMANQVNAAQNDSW
jgi:hypothetical protein